MVIISEPRRASADTNQALRIDPYIASSAPAQSFTSQNDGDQMDGLRAGADLKRSLPMFPQKRRCRDMFWALLFLLLTVTMVVGGFTYSDNLVQMSRRQANSRPRAVNMNMRDSVKPVDAVEVHMVRRLASAKILVPFPATLARRVGTSESGQVAFPVTSMFGGVVGGAIGGMLCSFAYMYLLKTHPEKVIRGTLYVMPILFLMLAVGFVGYGGYIVTMQPFMRDTGFIYLVFGGVFMLCFVCAVCQAYFMMELVPFAVTVVTAVMEVVFLHPSMFLVGICGVVFSTLWILICVLAGAGVLLEYEEELRGADPTIHNLLYFGFCFVTAWGSMISMNVTVVAYAGVFGRWYFGKPGPSVMPSLTNALTTSFGSVCFGSFIVAIVRALEAVARKMMEDAANDGNIVMCILACMVKCFLDCIGDMIEYFNAWAYVQCAVRNASFWEAAKITWSMCTCANVMLIAADCMLGWIAGMGSLLAAIVGGALGGALGYVLSEPEDAGAVASMCAMVAFISALITGTAICDILSTGTKTILVLWAEEPVPFQRSHPEIHAAFEAKVAMKLGVPADKAGAPVGATSYTEMQGQRAAATRY